MANELTQDKDRQEFEALYAEYKANSGKEVTDPAEMLEMIKHDCKYTDGIMIKAHLHKCSAVYRKPRVKDGKAFVTYLRREYQVVRAVQVYKSTWCYHISRGDFLDSKKTPPPPAKKFTEKQLEILLSSSRVSRYETAKNHGSDDTHDHWLIPIFKSSENRSAEAMADKGWGYVCSCSPHDNNFFRPIKGLIREAREQLDQLPRFHWLHGI